MAENEILQNITLSSDPCPICQDANGRQMTHEDWANSEWGLPGSDARYCAGSCHCILIPVGVVDQFPVLNERAKLRGEEGSEIRPVVDIGPKEGALKEIKELWNRDIGRLPKVIYKMKLEDIEPYLRELYTRFKAGGNVGE